MEMRRGSIHTLEAVIASFLLLTFVLTLLPTLSTENLEDREDGELVFENVRVFDSTGNLRDLVVEEDLKGIKSAMESRLPSRDLDISVLEVNSTSGEAHFSSYTEEVFSVNKSSSEEEILHIWLRNVSSPTVSINGIEIYSSAGRVEEEYMKIDIENRTFDGPNVLNISASSASRVGYSIDVYNSRSTGSPPGRNVFTVPYMISGNETSLRPAELGVIWWR